MRPACICTAIAYHPHALLLCTLIAIIYACTIQDIWSFGLVLLECASQHGFWDGCGQVETVAIRYIPLGFVGTLYIDYAAQDIEHSYSLLMAIPKSSTVVACYTCCH
jgi:hypothetical protein